MRGRMGCLVDLIPDVVRRGTPARIGRASNGAAGLIARSRSDLSPRVAHNGGVGGNWWG